MLQAQARGDRQGNEKLTENGAGVDLALDALGSRQRWLQVFTLCTEDACLVRVDWEDKRNISVPIDIVVLNEFEAVLEIPRTVYDFLGWLHLVA
jgi:hypothetical protein